MLDLKKWMTKVTNTFVPKTYSVTGAYSISVECKKRCGIVNIMIYQPSEQSLPKDQWTVLTTLPAEYRPLMNQRYLIPDNASSSGWKCTMMLAINTNGNVQIWPYSDAMGTNVVYGSVTYVGGDTA